MTRRERRALRERRAAAPIDPPPAPRTPEAQAATRDAITAPLAHDPTLTPREAAIVRHAGADPALFVAWPVTLQVAPPGVGEVHQVTDPRSGRVLDVVVVPMTMILPCSELRMSRVLGANGHAPSPLDGMIPIVAGRLVLPRVRLAAAPPVGEVVVFGSREPADG